MMTPISGVVYDVHLPQLNRHHAYDPLDADFRPAYLGSTPVQLRPLASNDTNTQRSQGCGYLRTYLPNER